MSDIVESLHLVAKEHLIPTNTYWKAAAEIERLEKENAQLSAWVCIFLDGSGLTGDDHGHQICLKARRLELDPRGPKT